MDNFDKIEVLKELLTFSFEENIEFELAIELLKINFTNIDEIKKIIEPILAREDSKIIYYNILSLLNIWRN